MKGSFSSFLPATFITLLVFVADAISKTWAIEAQGTVVSLIPGFLSLTPYHLNPGMAFGLALPQALQVALSLGLLVVLIQVMRPHSTRGFLKPLLFGMVLGGAVGNLVDRLRTGAVVDFIHLPHWPLFNLADAAITVGLVGLMIGIVHNPKQT